MMLPEPEYAQLAGMAVRNKAFMIELHGEAALAGMQAALAWRCSLLSCVLAVHALGLRALHATVRIVCHASNATHTSKGQEAFCHQQAALQLTVCVSHCMLDAEHPDALTFKDASQHGSHVHVGWMEGPGTLGENVTLMADTRAEQDMPGGPSSSCVECPCPAVSVIWPWRAVKVCACGLGWCKLHVDCLLLHVDCLLLFSSFHMSAGA
jgi:hypothetical protein